MHDQPQTTDEDYVQGFRRDLRDAVNAALVRDEIPVGETREIVIEVKKLRDNPLHDYRVSFR
jgi:hypothetical protein